MKMDKKVSLKHRSLVMTNKPWAEGRGSEVGLLAMTEARDGAQLLGPLFGFDVGSHSMAQAGFELCQYFNLLSAAARPEPPHPT